MKSIILAAGQGNRLRPLTDTKPKCLVEYKGKPLIDYILEAHSACGIKDISIVKGYKADALKRRNTKEYINLNYSTTNMVSTLFCAEEELDGDVIISYSDIIYSQQVLENLIDSSHDFAVVVDQSWRALWEKRMANPLEDAETLKLSAEGTICELGKKAVSYEEIQGQYIGLFKISRKIVHKVRNFYHSLDKHQLYDGKSFNNMYMTSFIQQVIDQLTPVYPVFISGGWLEVDCVSDLQIELESLNSPR